MSSANQNAAGVNVVAAMTVRAFEFFGEARGFSPRNPGVEAPA